MRAVWLALLLAWDYPTTPNPTNLTYEVWRSSDMTNWSKVATVATNAYAIPLTNRAGYFRVRTFDKATGLTSDWATCPKR